MTGDGDQSGEVTLTLGDEDTTEYSLSFEMDVDEGCGEDCYFAIYDGISCDDKGDEYYGTEESPWNNDDAGFSASMNGIAAGTMTLDTGKTWGDLHCTVFIAYKPEEESKSKKSAKKRARKLKSEGGPTEMMCGVLKKDGFDGTCMAKKSSKSRRNRNF